MGCHLYILDATTKESSRAWRLSMVQIAYVVAGGIAVVISGQLFKAFNFNTVYITALVLHTVVLLYAIFVLKEKRENKRSTKV